MGTYSNDERIREQVRRDFLGGNGIPEGLTVRQTLTLAYGDSWDEQLPHGLGYATTRYIEGYPVDLLVLERTVHNLQSGEEEPDYVANSIVLLREWADSHVIAVEGGFALMVAIGLDDRAPGDLLEVITKLASDSGVLDTEVLHDVEQGRIFEHWNSSGLHEARQALAERLGVEVDRLPEGAGRMLRDTALGGLDDDYPELSAAGSECNFHLDKVVEHVVRQLLVVTA
ncbi:hypothetical protein ACQPW1_10315 [Nocardia sp. CA-128927]|uniref:hypothetical protein n=1 Tax=Nocardia sp. CA-128927 TaxID=3239975 RepID=UPI003D98B98A